MKRLLLLVVALISVSYSVVAQKYSIGDLVYDDAGVANGIICYVSDDATQALALSFAVAKVSWATKGVVDTADDIALPSMYTLNSVGDADDCLTFLKSLRQYGNNCYPAFHWAESLGQGWYIPTRRDWMDCIMPAFRGQEVEKTEKGKPIYDMKTDLNEKMIAAGGVPYDNGKGLKVRYWSSNLKDDKVGSKARSMRPCYHDSVVIGKSTSSFARAVKYINM